MPVNTNNSTQYTLSDADRQALLEYLSKQKVSQSDAIKNALTSMGKDAAKDYGKYYLLSGGSPVATASEASQAAWNAGAGLGGLAPDAASATEASQAAWNAGAMGTEPASESLLGAAAPYLGGATALYGAYNTGKALQNGGKGIRSGMGTLGAGVGTILAPGLGTVVGAGVGNALGYGMDKLGLYHTSTKQRRKQRRNKLANDASNSWNAFASGENDAATQAEVKANMEKANAATADDYVGWWDDPNTEQNEWTWVNKKTPKSGFKQNDPNYQATLGSGDIMWMPTFFENIPEWANLSMEQRDKIANKALELGRAKEGGIKGNAGDLDISKDLWKGELGDYAKEVVGNNTSSNTSSNTTGDSTVANNTLTTTSTGRPIGVVGSIFYPGDGSKPIYIGNYNNANAVKQQLALAQANADLKRGNGWGNVATAFLAPYLGLGDFGKKDDNKKKDTGSIMTALLGGGGDNVSSGSSILDADLTGDIFGLGKSLF